MSHEPQGHRGSPRLALVHDYLTEMGGAERVLKVLHDLFPAAPLYTSVYDEDACGPWFAAEEVRTTFMQSLAKRKATTKALSPLFPLAFRSIDLDRFDVVLSSSSGFAHHIRRRKKSLHICYCHNPPRFLWQPSEYFRKRRLLQTALTPVLAGMRRLDCQASTGVDLYIANSRTVASRIDRTYGREAVVLHPPVDVSAFPVTTERSGRFVVVSRLLSYKRIDLAVEAATSASLPLDVIGDGPERSRLESVAGPTVRFLGRQPDEAVKVLLARCTALVLPGTEDFGLTPVEAQASGRPTVAFAAGGALETVVDGLTGVLFHEQEPECLVGAMRRVSEMGFSTHRLRSAAWRFDVSVFEGRMKDLLEGELDRRAHEELRD